LNIQKAKKGCKPKRLGGKMGLWLDLARNLFLDSRRLFSETSLPCACKPEGSPTTMCPTLLDVLRKRAYGLTLL
jgi:hypothetical protein